MNLEFRDLLLTRVREPLQGPELRVAPDTAVTVSVINTMNEARAARRWRATLQRLTREPRNAGHDHPLARQYVVHQQRGCAFAQPSHFHLTSIKISPVSQRNTPYSDGVPGATQCLIAASSGVMVYHFRTPSTPGTFWRVS